MRGNYVRKGTEGLFTIEDHPLILVTGGAGFIGSILCMALLDEGYRVRVLDTLFFGGGALLNVYGHPRFEFIRGDVRDASVCLGALKGVRGVIHLAALREGDCNRFPIAATQINQDATRQIVNLCRECKVERFVFSSSCSNYGTNGTGEYLDEHAPLSPRSVYSQTKVRAEEHVLESVSDTFNPCVLRFATAFGTSPQMRFDLLLHELLRDAMANGVISVYGATNSRPFVHVRDIARACLLVLASPASSVRSNVYNIGSTKENYTKLELAKIITTKIAGTKVELSTEKSDPRNYRVSFEKAGSGIGFIAQTTVPNGINEFLNGVATGVIDLSGLTLARLEPMHF